MPITVGNTLISTAVPTPVTPPTPVLRSTASDGAVGIGSLAPFASGVNAGLATALNKVETDIGNVGMYGGNGYGIVQGLGLSPASGLLVAIAAGFALGNGWMEVAATTITVTDAARSYLWLKSDGTVGQSATLSPPALGIIYLGSSLAVSGSVTALDDSGVLTLHGGIFTRRTADLGPPADAPASTALFETRTASGAYLWDGFRHRLIVDTVAPDKDTLVSGDVFFIPAGFQKQIFGPLSLSGTGSMTILGRLKII